MCLRMVRTRALFGVGKSIVPLVGSSHRSDSLSVLSLQCGLEFSVLFYFSAGFSKFMQAHPVVQKIISCLEKVIFGSLGPEVTHTHTQTHIFEVK